MVKTIITAYPTEKKEAKQDGSGILNVAELFMNTIQGENLVGYPSTFLRLQGCTLNCVWCDTKEVWREGNPYSILELIEIMNNNGVINKLMEGQHLVLTGGSPMKQQAGLLELITTIESKYQFQPFVEVENECTLMPSEDMFKKVDLWNNSPKLASSGMPMNARYHPEILKKLSEFNSYFKFVITCEEDWNEIDELFLKTKLIHKYQVVLMPEGMTREELQQHYLMVVEMACRENVRMTDRLHVTIFNRKTGV